MALPVQFGGDFPFGIRTNYFTDRYLIILWEGGLYYTPLIPVFRLMSSDRLPFPSTNFCKAGIPYTAP